MEGFKKRLGESVQRRLAMALSSAILIVALVASLFAFISAFEEAHEMQDDTLRQVAILFDRQQMTLAYPDQPAITGDDEESRVTVQYLADGNKAHADADTATPLPLPVDLADGIWTLNVADEPFRVLVHTTARGERIAVAQETGSRDHSARESAWRSLVPFLILFPVLLLVVGDLVRKLFRPIAALSAEIDQRADQALHPVDVSHVPSEVRPFVVAINRLLERIAGAMQAQGRFVADAAHELRSPLTALSLQAERLANAPMSEQAQERLLPLRRGIDRGVNLVEQLLSLSRAGATSPQPVVTLSVQAMFRRVLEDLLPHAELKQIDLGVVGTEDVQLRLNEMDLLTLIRNLVDNAVRYTPAGGRVDLSVRRDRGAVLIQVRDTGPGITREERQRVFDPFYRSLGTDQPGSGLGLAIVKTIAQRINATLRLEPGDAGTDTGLLVSVILQGNDEYSAVD